MTSTGVNEYPSETTDSNGAFNVLIPLSEPAGTYSVFMQSTSGTPLGSPVTYTVTPYFVINYGSNEWIYSPFEVTAYGLQPNTYYDLFLNSTFIDEQQTNQYGVWSATETVPLVPAGNYTLYLAPASSPSTPVVSHPFVVIPNPFLVLSTMSQFAFPGQLVQFSAYVGSIPIPSGASVTGYSAEVLLNGTVFAQVPATYAYGTISGSFKMPNNLPGSYYELEIIGLASYTYNQSITTAEQLPLGATAYTTTSSSGAVTLTVTFTSPNYGPLTTAAITGTGNYELGSSPYYAVVTSYSAPSSSATGSITFSIATIGALNSTYADTITSSPATIKVAAVPSSGYNQSSIVTLSGTYVAYTSQKVQFSGTATSTGSQSDFFGLAQGNGALLTGITPGEMATLQAQISSTISTSMQVPLSELNASVVAINKAVATIKTAFGNMTASLSAINATVKSISNGIATVNTDLGTVETSLANLNATVLGISHNMVVLNTAVGKVETSLTAINATLMGVSNGVMTLNTDAGTLMASISALNATVSSISGNVVTIMTSAGKIQATLNSINATLMSVNGTTATIKTSLGTVTTSLSSINAQLTSINGNVATVQTSLGTLTGTVTSINGSVATINTKLGTLQTSVNGVTSSVNTAKSGVSNTIYFEIIILVLVLITLVIALISMLNANKVIRRLDELKKQ